MINYLTRSPTKYSLCPIFDMSLYFCRFSVPPLTPRHHQNAKFKGAESFFWGEGDGAEHVTVSGKSAADSRACVSFLLGVNLFLELFPHLFT